MDNNKPRRVETWLSVCPSAGNSTQTQPKLGGESSPHADVTPLEKPWNSVTTQSLSIRPAQEGQTTSHFYFLFRQQRHETGWRAAQTQSFQTCEQPVRGVRGDWERRGKPCTNKTQRAAAATAATGLQDLNVFPEVGWTNTVMGGRRRGDEGDARKPRKRRKW